MSTISPEIADPEVRTTDPEAEEGDHDRFAHYIRKADQARAYIEGVPVKALCGKVWVPNRDPSRYPICPTCEVMMKRIRGAGQN
jgi:hypothetical protein